MISGTYTTAITAARNEALREPQLDPRTAALLAWSGVAWETTWGGDLRERFVDTLTKHAALARFIAGSAPFPDWTHHDVWSHLRYAVDQVLGYACAFAAQSPLAPRPVVVAGRLNEVLPRSYRVGMSRFEANLSIQSAVYLAGSLVRDGGWEDYVLLGLFAFTFCGAQYVGHLDRKYGGRR